MIISDIITRRLSNQYLARPIDKTPEEVIDWLGAMQAQDYYAAQWSLGQRVVGATQKTIEDAFNDGKILRTHVMRPTWHFVMPQDIRWMLELTASRVKQFMAHYNRKLELTDDLFNKTHKTIEKALKNNNYLTRQEIKMKLAEVNVKTDVQRLGHIVAWAELDGLICSGPRKGLQQTYALVDERVPKVKTLPRDEALATLATKYFRSHGPAQVKDFSWWSGLTVKDAENGIDMIKSKLQTDEIDGKKYWFVDKKITEGKGTFLLSIYDEYVIAYKDRGGLGAEEYANKLFSMGNLLTAVLIVDGLIAGTWKRMLKKDSVTVVVSPLRKLTSKENKEVKQAVEVYGEFLGLKAILTLA